MPERKFGYEESGRNGENVLRERGKCVCRWERKDRLLDSAYIGSVEDVLVYISASILYMIPLRACNRTMIRSHVN